MLAYFAKVTLYIFKYRLHLLVSCPAGESNSVSAGLRELEIPNLKQV